MSKPRIPHGAAVIQISMHHVTNVAVVLHEHRDDKGCHDYDAYDLDIITQPDGPFEHVKLTLFAEPGADIGLGLLVHGDEAAYDSGFCDGVASKGEA